MRPAMTPMRAWSATTGRWRAATATGVVAPIFRLRFGLLADGARCATSQGEPAGDHTRMLPHVTGR